MQGANKATGARDHPPPPHTQSNTSKTYTLRPSGNEANRTPLPSPASKYTNQCNAKRNLLEHVVNKDKQNSKAKKVGRLMKVYFGLITIYSEHTHGLNEQHTAIEYPAVHDS